MTIDGGGTANYHGPLQASAFGNIGETMNKFLAVVIAVILAVESAYGATTTYRIVDYPNDENGFSQSAAATPSFPYSYIVTDGTIGQLTQSDIVHYDWAYRNPNATTGIATIGAEGDSTAALFDDLIATPTELLLSSGGSLSLGGGDVLDYNNSSGTPSFACYETSPFLYAWDTSNPTMNGAEPWVIAVVVPEPSTAALCGVAACTLVLWRRRLILARQV